MDPILGQIMLWPVPWIPRGWALCDGRELQIQHNQALFSLLGEAYGGDGMRTFKLPDLRTRFAAGAPAVTQLGQLGGAAAADLAAITGAGSVSIGVEHLPPHSHGATFTPGPGASVKVSVPADANGVSAESAPGPNRVLGNVSAGSLAARVYSTDAPNTTLAPFHIEVPSGAGAVTVGDTGSGHALPLRVALSGSVGTLPPFTTLNFIIATEGIYPSRPD